MRVNPLLLPFEPLSHSVVLQQFTAVCLRHAGLDRSAPALVLFDKAKRRVENDGVRGNACMSSDSG